MAETALGGTGGTGGTGTTQGGGTPSPSGGAPSSASGASTHPSGQAAPPSSGGSGNWRDGLPEEIRNHSTISSFQDVPSLVKSFIHAQSLVGKKGVIPPQWDKATPEEKAQFYSQIGMPKPEEYQVTLPKDYEMSEEDVSAFKEQVMKEGLLPHQANNLLDFYAKIQTTNDAKEMQEIEKVAQEQMEGLKKEWGDAYDSQVSKARLAVREIGGEDFVKYLNETGMGNDIQLIRFAAKAAQLMSEDKLREGGLGDGRMSTQEIQDQLTELRSKGKENGLFDMAHPMHFATLRKMESLAKMLTGGA